MQVVKSLSIAAVLFAALFGRPVAAQSKPVATERTIVILVTKERFHISTDGNLAATASRKDLDGDGLLIRCNSCELDRQDAAKTSLTFRCQGDVLVEGHLFTIRADSVSRKGARLVAVGTADKSAKIWTWKAANKKNTSFSAGERIAFDIEKSTIEVGDGSVLDLGLPD